MQKRGLEEGVEFTVESTNGNSLETKNKKNLNFEAGTLLMHFFVTNYSGDLQKLLRVVINHNILCFLSLSYITIFHALRYHNIMTMQRTGGILVFIWTTCGVSAVLMVRFFDFKFIMICFVVFFIVSLGIICFLYVYMFLLARIHAKSIAALPPGGEGKCQCQRRWASNIRGALTLTILFGAFVVCWAPFFTHLIIIMVCPLNPYCECYRSLFQLHVVLIMSHALIDPAIYAFRSAELRYTFRKMLLCLSRKLCC